MMFQNVVDRVAHMTVGEWIAIIILGGIISYVLNSPDVAAVAHDIAGKASTGSVWKGMLLVGVGALFARALARGRAAPPVPKPRTPDPVFPPEPVRQQTTTTAKTETTVTPPL
jgi:hypothetical protein